MIKTLQDLYFEIDGIKSPLFSFYKKIDKTEEKEKIKSLEVSINEQNDFFSIIKIEKEALECVKSCFKESFKFIANRTSDYLIKDPGENYPFFIVIEKEDFEVIKKKVNSRIKIEIAVLLSFLAKRNTFEKKGKANKTLKEIFKLIEITRNNTFSEQLGNRYKFNRLRLAYTDNTDMGKEKNLDIKDFNTTSEDSELLAFFLKSIEAGFDHFEKNYPFVLNEKKDKVNTQAYFAKEFLNFCNDKTTFSENKGISRRDIFSLFTDIYELSGHKFQKTNDKVELVESWYTNNV